PPQPGVLPSPSDLRSEAVAALLLTDYRVSETIPFPTGNESPPGRFDDITPDGKYLLWSHYYETKADRRAHLELWLQDKVTRAHLKRWSCDGYGAKRLSPDGEVVGYIDEWANRRRPPYLLFRSKATTLPLRPLEFPPDPDAVYHSPTFSPDGR